MKSGAVSAAVISGVNSGVVIVGIFILALAIVATPLLLALLHKKSGLVMEDAKGKLVPTSFFQLPYITWFLIHFLVPFFGILAVVGLALAGVLESSTTGTLLGGLFGYVLGSASKGQPGASKPDANAGLSGKSPQAQAPETQSPGPTDVGS